MSRIKQEIQKVSALGIPMRLRAFLFLVTMVFTMVLALIVILLLTGTLSAGLKASERLFEQQLTYTIRSISRQFDEISAQTVEFSEDLTKKLTTKLGTMGLDATQLSEHPEILEELMANDFESVLFALRLARASGAYVILDATVNPKLERAITSKAGLYLKNMEPNVISSSSPNVSLLRGFPKIAWEHSVPLHAQWNMEFDVKDAKYYSEPMAEAVREDLPLSRLYSWSPSFTFPGTSERVMLCSTPLRDAKGNVFGVCGFEVSSMLFKLAHVPDNSGFSRVFCVLAPILSTNTLDVSQGLMSGGYPARSLLLGDKCLTFEEGKNSFTYYKGEDMSPLMGFHSVIKMYPDGSAFEEQEWAVAIMAPADDIRRSATNYDLRLSLVLGSLVIIGILMSLLLSRQYVQPISKGLDMVRSSNPSEITKTKIPEIDDLIEFLLTRQEKMMQEDDEGSSILNEFTEKVKTLTRAERRVFNLYAKKGGYTTKQIAGELCLSINTIKTHTRRIYSKLGVSSKDELLLYIEMLKEAGKDLE